MLKKSNSAVENGLSSGEHIMKPKKIVRSKNSGVKVCWGVAMSPVSLFCLMNRWYFAQIFTIPAGDQTTMRLMMLYLLSSLNLEYWNTGKDFESLLSQMLESNFGTRFI